MTLKSRLQAVRELSGLSQSKFSQKLGFNRSFWNLVESERTAPTPKLLEVLEAKLRINREWLLHGNGEMLLGTGAGFEAGRHVGTVKPPDYARPGHGDFAANDREYVFVRRFEVDLSAGTGAVAAPEDDHESVAFTTAFLYGLGVNSDLCGLVRVKGQSMGSTVPDGSLVLISFAEREILREGIYAFGRDDMSFIKRLIPLEFKSDGRPQKVMILGDGLAAAPETVSGPDLLDLQIIGRVRAVLSTFA